MKLELVHQTIFPHDTADNESTAIPTVVGVVPMVLYQEIFLCASLPDAEDQISSLLHQHCNMIGDA